MCTVVGTPQGRIFAGGSDGHVHEILYEVCPRCPIMHVYVGV
jgi:hypothetical protein